MTFVIQCPFLFCKCWSDDPPIGISSKENDNIYITSFPGIMNYVVFTTCFYSFDLDSVVARPI